MLARTCCVLTVLVAGAVGAAVSVYGGDGVATIENDCVRIDFNLNTGTYRAIDKRDGSTCLAAAHARVANLEFDRPGARRSWTAGTLHDELGRGKYLEVRCTLSGRPTGLLRFGLYEGRGFLVLTGGLRNTTSSPIRVLSIEPLATGKAFVGLDLSQNFSLLDGRGGGEETHVVHGGSLRSRNNLLVTFGPPGKRRSLVLGGLTYHDFEKFAAAGRLLDRRRELREADPQHPLAGYLNLGEETNARSATGCRLRVKQGKSYRWDGQNPAGEPFPTIVFHEQAVILSVEGLDPAKNYTLGLSWWDYDHNGRRESVVARTPKGERQAVLLADRQLPAWREKRQLPEQIEVTLPQWVYASGALQLEFRNEAKVPNAVVSEVWLREGVKGPQPVIRPVRPPQQIPPGDLQVRLFARDPVGKRLDPGTTYLPDDRFYLDFTTDDPFAALEQYGQAVRAAQRIWLNVYDFPTVCLWYAEVFGGGQVSNDTKGAVVESDRIAGSGFLKYSRAAVRLVPDCYDKLNQQGWWDDEHWKRWSGNPKRGNGRYVAPYDTTRKWAGAVTARGVIPLTYCQTGRVSADYGPAFPGHMLFNRPTGASYDYTDPGFQRHLREVYANLKTAGVRGLMFDYPNTGWHSEGGFEDKYATTASAYRTIFRLAYDGLGPDCWIHERNLSRGSDVTLGLVTSQRVWGDTDLLTPQMVARCALRWYKNRVVVNYDMDAKSLLKATPPNRDGVRAMLTMCYVVSGRLLLATSFGRLTAAQLHDLSRVFPFHAAPRTARPLDAFLRPVPRLYDFFVAPDWHQVTLYNPDREPWDATIALSGDTAEGALGLDPGQTYYVYDFWNDRFVGRLRGDSRLTQKLRPGEARMLSVRRAATVPQFLSTNRHVMQGYVDMLRCQWDAKTDKLVGRSIIAGGETYKVILATNGYKATGCSARGARAALRQNVSAPGLLELSLDSPNTGAVDWRVAFRPVPPQ